MPRQDSPATPLAQPMAVGDKTAPGENMMFSHDPALYNHKEGGCADNHSSTSPDTKEHSKVTTLTPLTKAWCWPKLSGFRR
jgi:hypothetical protein